MEARPMSFDEQVRYLQTRLKKPLPGLPSQLRMSSNTRIRELMNYGTPETATPSSVLLLLYPVHGETWTVFIRRPDYDGIHSGQIALPGGKWEPADTDPAQTALREAREEIGIDPDKVTLLGKLTDLYIPPSNYIVSPFIGYAKTRPEFVTDPSEVKNTVEVRISDLLSGDHLKEVQIRISGGFELTAPAFVIGEEIIWGATAMMVAEFCEIMGSKEKGSSVE